LLAATVRSFAHMPLGISDRNTGLVPPWFSDQRLLGTWKYFEC